MAKIGSKYKRKEPIMSNKKSWEVVIQRYTDVEDHFLFDFDAEFDTIVEEVFGTYEALGKAVHARNFLINESRSGGDAFGLSRINAVYIRSKDDGNRGNVIPKTHERCPKRP